MHEFSDPYLAEIWNIILRPGAAADERFANMYYNWHRPTSLEGVLGQPRIWTSWGYKAAYPKLATFLENVTVDNKLHAQVIMEEVETSPAQDQYQQYQHREFRYNEALASLSVIFNALKTLPTQAEHAISFAQVVKGHKRISRYVRVLQVSDISPLVLSCILGTSSRFVCTIKLLHPMLTIHLMVCSLDVSHIAAFLDRHLNGVNWAKVNLLKTKQFVYIHISNATIYRPLL